MSPILGIWASQNYPRITNSYDSIATVVGNGSASTLTLSSIPSTYKHLQLRISARDARSTDNDTFQMYFNSDAGAGSPNNYSRHALRGNGTSASAYSVVQQSGDCIGLHVGPAANSLGSVFSAGVVDILDYTNTNKFKTVRSLGGYDTNGGASFVELVSSLWNSTSAITSITFFNNGSSAWTSSTQFSLYGIRG